MEPPLLNALSVDVEDYFQVGAFEGVIDRADWERLPVRVERNVEAVLALSRLTKRLRFEFAGDKPPSPLHQITLRPRGGMPMKVTARGLLDPPNAD